MHWEEPHLTLPGLLVATGGALEETQEAKSSPLSWGSPEDPSSPLWAQHEGASMPVRTPAALAWALSHQSGANGGLGKGDDFYWSHSSLAHPRKGALSLLHFTDEEAQTREVTTVVETPCLSDTLSALLEEGEGSLPTLVTASNFPRHPQGSAHSGSSVVTSLGSMVDRPSRAPGCPGSHVFLPSPRKTSDHAGTSFLGRNTIIHFAQENVGSDM